MDLFTGSRKHQNHVLEPARNGGDAYICPPQTKDSADPWLPDLLAPVSDSVQILRGDCLDILPTRADESIHCCITSPPYYALRDYGVDGQIGLEETPEEWVAKLVAVFREVRRVLRPDGTLWLNLGDTYAHSGACGGESPVGPIRGRAADAIAQRKTGSRIPRGMKPKNLLGLPWRVAFALQADGWILRQDIIWAKPNPMPESCTDRCTKAHEYLFLLAKSPRYYFDQDAIAEQAAGVSGGACFGKQSHDAAGTLAQQRTYERPEYTARNKRSVWTITPAPFSEAHFATFPPALVEPCLLAGCPEGGTVLDPFGGSGTVGEVAMKQRKRAVLIELNPEYVDMMERRLEAARA